MKRLTLEWVEKAVNYRYPGENATKEEAQAVIRICRGFREVARQSLGLEA
jgi:hypothetical protein